MLLFRFKGNVLFVKKTVSMKKLLPFLTHLLAACPVNKNRDGLDSRIQKETDCFIMTATGNLVYSNLNRHLKVVDSGYGSAICNNAC
jgi:hypothetical protein